MHFLIPGQLKFILEDWASFSKAIKTDAEVHAHPRSSLYLSSPERTFSRCCTGYDGESRQYGLGDGFHTAGGALPKGSLAAHAAGNDTLLGCYHE